MNYMLSLAEPDLNDFAKPDPRIGPKHGLSRDSKLLEYRGYDEAEEDLKG